MEITTTFFCNGIDDTRHCITILSIKCTTDYLKFLDARVIDINAAAIIINICDRDTICLEVSPRQPIILREAKNRF
jgi:hypothetical protein